MVFKGLHVFFLLSVLISSSDSKGDVKMEKKKKKQILER